jgi:demethylmenaquinone methyltransferase / 2-methoxy-6-polyprenyl-1,4-benzoquinol methylase
MFAGASTHMSPQSDQTPQPAHVPHAPLTDYYTSEQERAGFVRRIFDSTAPDYDRMERILGFGTGSWYRGQALKRAGLRSGMRMVDVGVGTGLVAREAVRIVGNPRLVVGVDPSPGMMANARLLEGVDLLEGTAESIPFPDASFDFLSMGYALRHIGDLSLAFREFHRVMKPGARLCLLEITRPEKGITGALIKAYMKFVVPLLGRIVGSEKRTGVMWRYYWDTVEACVPPDQVLATLESAGFAGVRRHIDTMALSMLSEFQAFKPE